MDSERYEIVSGDRSPALHQLLLDRSNAAIRLVAVAGERTDALMDEVTRREILFNAFKRTNPGSAADSIIAALESVTRDVTMGWL